MAMSERSVCCYLCDSKVSGHEDDDHQCEAVTHACSEVTVAFHSPQYYMLYLTFLAI